MSKFNRPVRPEYDRAVFEVLHALAGVPSTQIAKKTWVSAGTISKWRRGPKFGGTRYPQHATMAAVAKVAGLKWVLVEDKAKGAGNDARREKSSRSVSAAVGR